LLWVESGHSGEAHVVAVLAPLALGMSAGEVVLRLQGGTG